VHEYSAVFRNRFLFTDGVKIGMYKTIPAISDIPLNVNRLFPDNLTDLPLNTI